MHIITPYNPWAPKGKKKTWQEQLWEQQQIAELEAKVIAEASSKSLPQNAPQTSVATVGPMAGTMAGGGGTPPPQFFTPATDVVAFTFSPATAAAPWTVQLVNQTTTPQFDAYKWSFGDGVTSNAPNPSHIFDTGSFTVKLEVSNSVTGVPGGSVTHTVSASIPTVAANYTFTTSSNIAPYSASFVNTTVNTSQTPTTTYNWVVKDGLNTYTSAATNFSVRIDSGSVTASLGATGSYAITNATSSMFFSTAPTLTAGFTVTVAATAPATGTFVNTTTYNGSGTLTYLWTYGSQSLTSTSITAAPIAYTVAGPYTASLAVTESKYGITSFVTRSFRLS